MQSAGRYKFVETAFEFAKLLPRNASILAFDIGTARTGLAETDRSNSHAVPLLTFRHCANGNVEGLYDARINTILRNKKYGGFIVGNPIDLDGISNEQGAKTMHVLNRLLIRAKRVNFPIFLKDERYSSRFVEDQIGACLRKDELAACLLLQEFLDYRSATKLSGLLREHTFKTTVIKDAPESFYRFLAEDSIVLFDAPPKSGFSADDSSDDSSNDDTQYAGGLVDESLLSFHERLAKEIALLGGKVFVKLGSCSPKDASWISTYGESCCYEPNDIYQLLKASERISLLVDVLRKPELVLRQWTPLDPAMEFRCFVKDSRLIAVSQRIDTQFFPVLLELEAQLCFLIENFFKTLIKIFPAPSFGCDIYIDWPQQKVYIVDLSPWDRNELSPILFSWDELEERSSPENDWEFRVIESESSDYISRPKTLLGPVELENLNDFDVPADISDMFNRKA